MKAMILSAGVGSRLMPLTMALPKPMLSIANKPALYHIVNLCSRHGIKKIKMNLHYLPESVDQYFRDGSEFGVEISYSLEKKLMGTAGGIKRIQSFFDETFVVLSGDGFTNIDITEMYSFHKANNALATIAVKKVEDTSKFGVVVTDENGSIKSFQEKPKKEEALSNLANLGIYIFEPQILDMIPRGQEYDFGYNLFPDLLERGERFFAYSSSSYWSDIGSLEEYWKVNLDLASGKVQVFLDDTKEIRQGIFVHNSSGVPKEVLDKASAPVIIGRNTNIGQGVELKGPLVIGEEVYIDDNAKLIRSVVLSNTYVGKGVELSESVVSQNYHMSVKNKFGTFIDDDNVLKSHYFVPFEARLNAFLISATDRILSFFALLFLCPVFTVIAILIKMTSNGPVFYISKRLRSPAVEKKGKDWYVYIKEKPVKYYVFRTMYTEADKRVKELKNKYDSGPYVKIEDDPRVTKIGKFLRKTSIDELPLFWNVLKGDMSLVGIWALPTYEAEYILREGLKGDEESAGVDLSELARVRFEGKLGIAGFWQARGRSNLTAEERAIHDSFQSAMENISDKQTDYLGEYAKFKTYGGYLKMLAETFKSVVKREGAM
jgi:mannose-1-phosphate guanylyltransferase/mannose-1-phosphate guanylyltransferase/phosphomannomutase